uniref:BRCC36 C-terminal helical domain-containing protein n=1 Tax=Fagus sylvatica TaxID=28930 RepID=A0A2N9HR01_FAGSY
MSCKSRLELTVGGRSLELGVFFANADANHLGRERVGANYHADSSDNIIVDVDPMDMSESMQEAMHRSNLDMSGAEYVRKEVPLHVLPTSSLVKLDSPLMSFTDLQRVLYEEERAAYNQAILQNMRDGKVHPLSFIHHTSTYQASMCKLIEYCLSPAIKALQDRLKENEIRLRMLTNEAKILETEAPPRGVESSSVSPRQASSHGPRGNTSLGHRDLYSSAEPTSTRSVAGSGSRSRKGHQ